MAGPGGPGSACFRSARAGRAGVREAAAQQKREPDAELEQPSGTTPELDPARSRRCACVLPAAPPGASGRRLVGRLRRFHSRPSSRELGDSSRRGSSTYGKTTKRGIPEKGDPEEKPSAYGAPRGPRRDAIRVSSPGDASRRTTDEVSGDSHSLSRLACAGWRSRDNCRDGGWRRGGGSN